MKKLKMFNHFKIEEFLAEKKLMCLSVSDWKDYTSGKILGSVAELVILEDKTDYHLEEGETASNVFEKFKVKVPTAINIPVNSIVTLVAPTATIFGDYDNQISVRAENIKIVKP